MWRRSEPPLDRETVDGIIKMLTEIHSNLELVIDHLGLGDEDEEEDDS